MMPVGQYPTVEITKFEGKPVGKANFKEPIFHKGVFTEEYLDVEVTVFSGQSVLPGTREILIPVRFGEMNVIRFVNRELLSSVSVK